MTDGDGEAQRYDFVAGAGDDFLRLLTVMEADGSAAADITDWPGFTLTIYKSYADKIAGNPALFSLILGSGITVTDAGNGDLRVFIARADLLAAINGIVFQTPLPGQRVPRLRFVYDFVTIDDAGTETTQMAGDFTVLLRLK